MKSLLGTAVQKEIPLLELQAPVYHGCALLRQKCNVNRVLQKSHFIPKPDPVMGMGDVALLTHSKPFESVFPGKRHAVDQEDQNGLEGDAEQGIHAYLELH